MKFTSTIHPFTAYLFISIGIFLSQLLYFSLSRYICDFAVIYELRPKAMGGGITPHHPPLSTPLASDGFGLKLKSTSSQVLLVNASEESGPQRYLEFPQKVKFQFIKNQSSSKQITWMSYVFSWEKNKTFYFLIL